VKTFECCPTWLGNLLIFLGSIAGLFIAGEILLSIFVPTPIIWLHPQASFIHHPKLIHKLKPNQQAFTHSFPVVTNSYGLRNEEFAIKASADTFRILCLGDSLTFGNGVRIEDTYPKQLESMLNSDGKRKYEVINGGVPAYDTWAEVTYFREYGWRFHPALVVIGFYANDIVPKPVKIPHIVNESGAIKRPGLKGLISNKVAYALKKSRVLLILRVTFQQLKNRLNPSPAFRHKLALLNGTVDPFVERGWREVEASLEEISNLAKRDGFRVLLVLFPMPDQFLKSYPSASYGERLKNIAQRYDIHFTDLMPVFAAAFNGFESLFIKWDGHPNARAYAIAAREIRKYLLRNPMLLRSGTQ